MDMKKITLNKVLHVLETEENQAEVSKEIMDFAKQTLTRMLELAK